MKKLLLVLFTHIVAIQALFAQLEIETTVPTGFDEAINVGVGTGHFETTITNKGGSENITGIKVSPQGGLNGLEIVPTTATYVYRGAVYSAIVTGDIVKTNGSLSLYAGEQITFNYEKRAKCSIVPNASSGYSMQVIDDITVLGTNYSEQTNSYPVLFPGLSVIVPESPLNNKQVAYREDFSDEVAIKNEQNSGKVSSLIIRMEYNQQVLSVNKIEIQGSAGTIERNITANNVEIRLESSDLETLGFEDGIMPANSQFKVVSYGRVEEYSATTQVKYSVDYVAFNETCQRLRNAEGIMYFQQKQPNPQITVEKVLISSGNYCGNKIVIDYIIHQKGEKTPSNYILDTRFFLFYDNVEIESVTYTNTNTVLTKQNGYYRISNLGDLDGNQIHSDFNGNEDIVLRVTASPKVPSSGFHHRIRLSFEGRKIDGNSFSAGADDLVQVYDVSSYASCDATLDERTYPEGKAWFTYSFKDWPASLRFINYTINYTPPFGTRTPIVKTDDTREETIYACQSGDITFKLEVTTGGCEQGVVITSASPQVVQRCYGTGSGCYGGSVDTAFFNKKSINTCQEVELKARGSIEYNCNKDCPRYKSIIVNIDDITNQLPFVVTNPTLNNVSYIREYNYKGKGHSYEYTFDDSACTRIIGEKADTNIILGHEFEFESLVSVPSHFSQDRIDANIQVKYILLDKNDTIHDGTWTWGDALTVYDPKPKFGVWSALLYGCMNKYVEINMSEGAMDETRSVEIKEIKYPGVPDFYYKSGAVGDEYYSDESGLHIGQGESALSSFVSMSPKCVENRKSYGARYGYIKYVDFEGTSCEDTVELNKEFYSSATTEMPEITLHPTSQQQSISQTTTWTLLMENTGSKTAENVMLRITPREDNKMYLYIEKITIDGVEREVIQGDDNVVYIQIGRVSSDRKVIEIEAKYRNCTERGVSYIDVESAWSCESLSPENFDKFNCGSSTVLELENMVAVLNAIETYPKEYFNLCEDIPIHLDVSNIGRADLSQMGFWFEKIPYEYSITDDAITSSYNNETKEITNISSASIPNIILSQEILNSKHGVFNANTSMYIDFNIQTDCSDDKLGAEKILFSVNGISNCGEIQERKFAFSPKLKGFEALDSISISGRQISEFEKPQDTASFIACIQNNSSRLVDSAFISVLIPVGYEIVGYTPLQDGTVSMMTESVYNDTLILYQWELTKHSNIQANDSVAVKFDITSNLDCPPSGKISYYGTLKRYMFDCTGDSCLTSRSTNPIYVDLTPKYPLFSAEMIGNSSTCVGTNTNYQIQGQGIQSIQWNCQFPYIENGNEISITYENTGEYTIQALVTGQCESKTVQTKTEVLSIPDISIDESKNVTWRKWEEEGVTCIDSSLNIENWTIPQIDTCGTYTLTYTEGNQCGQSSQDMDLTIYRCCEIEPIVLPDTVFIQWYDEWNEDLAQHIDYQPKDGVFELNEGESHNMCGEYLFRYTVSQCDTVYSDSVIIIVENCCGENPMGDIVITDRQGVTTFDVEVLRYYLKHPESLVKKSDEYESYYLQMEDCGETIKKVDLIRCFPQWIDINGDGSVDEKDVNELIKLVR